MIRAARAVVLLIAVGAASFADALRPPTLESEIVPLGEPSLDKTNSKGARRARNDVIPRGGHGILKKPSDNKKKKRVRVDLDPFLLELRAGAQHPPTLESDIIPLEPFDKTAVASSSSAKRSRRGRNNATTHCGGRGRVVKRQDTDGKRKAPSVELDPFLLELRAGSDAPAAGGEVVDNQAILLYIASAAIQLTLMKAFFRFLDYGLKYFEYAPPDYAVGLLFYALSLRSRIFNPLDNHRPDTSKAISGEETEGFNDRVVPSWTPPAFVFPIVWLLIIGPIRAVSSTMIYKLGGKTFAHPALLSLCLHLTAGDIWNTINNVEKRIGTSVVGVYAVLFSLLYAAVEYARVDRRAGGMLGATGLWLIVATSLISKTRELNPREDGSLEPMVPMMNAEEGSRTRFAWFAGNKKS